MIDYGELYNDCLKFYPNYKISDMEAMVAYSGEKTGRCPKDKRIVFGEDTMGIDWGNVNIPMSKDLYHHYKEKIKQYLLNKKDGKIYLIDGIAGWQNKINIKIISVNPYHAIFMKNMLINAKVSKIVDINFSKLECDFIIYALGELKLSELEKPILLDEIDKRNPLQNTLIGFNFADKSMLILGTECAGEIKKAIFTYMLYEMPKRGLLPLHSSANVDDNNNCTLFLGLSGTGKTTLSADEDSKLVGDDEHVWCDDGIYNIEGGCYAKCLYLQKDKEPQIYNAIKYGSILENVILNNGKIDFNDSSITDNTRCSYPLSYVDKSVIPAITNHPKNIIFLTCDATGLLPPICSLEDKNIILMFLAGYTSKIAGTEVGLIKNEPTFSACFAGPFIVWNPKLYGKMLEDKIKKYGSKVWLLNTGYNVNGERYPIKMSRKIIKDIKSGDIYKMSKKRLKYFDMDYYIDNDTYEPMKKWAATSHNYT
ncbi:phosphoenolpyruvate carboxykinase PEPCK [Catovirus CTV1]|uniref:phosphoenolpyruvate carboxykinase (ATP) n=1 Tax=Catovirus CTV1 TaxID=1977631 RepID=A0A1V0SAL7_9VIRU|nr:phosphoenolpyruvate carboxykinase PEPCK [Catovirus CTV1]